LNLPSSKSKAAPYFDCDKENAMTMVTGLFKDKDSAEFAFQSVVDLGYDKSDVNVVMSEEVRQRYFLAHNPNTDYPDTTDLEEKAAAADINNPANNTWGGPVGGTVGTLAPVVAAVGVLLIPGLGIVAGPLAIALVASAATGVAIGLMGILMNWGIPDSRVEQYEVGLRVGGILLGVKAHSDADALQIQQRWQEGGGEHIHS
jgi:hypothetical protein